MLAQTHIVKQGTEFATIFIIAHRQMALNLAWSCGTQHNQDWHNFGHSFPCQRYCDYCKICSSLNAMFAGYIIGVASNGWSSIDHKMIDSMWITDNRISINVLEGVWQRFWLLYFVMCFSEKKYPYFESYPIILVLCSLFKKMIDTCYGMASDRRQTMI